MNKLKELEIIDKVPGKGKQPVEKEDILIVDYTGTLYSNGVKFDSSLDRNQPLQVQIGVGQVIKGWDEGIIGMRIGGTRILNIPSEMGYGSKGAGENIPPDADLSFEVILRAAFRQLS